MCVSVHYCVCGGLGAYVWCGVVWCVCVGLDDSHKIASLDRLVFVAYGDRY